MEKSLWYIFLDYWCNKKVPLGSGLTLPYLIGIEHQFHSVDNRITIVDFIEDVAKNVVGEDAIFLKKCDNIGDLVFCLDNVNNPEKMHSNYIANIYVDESIKIGLSGKSGLVTLLTELYLDNLGKSLYSKSYGIWNKFSQAEMDMINENIKLK